LFIEKSKDKIKKGGKKKAKNLFTKNNAKKQKIN